MESSASGERQDANWIVAVTNATPSAAFQVGVGTNAHQIGMGAFDQPGAPANHTKTLSNTIVPSGRA